MSQLIQKQLKYFFKRYPVPAGSKIGVAVSGGADSLALALNLVEYARQNHLTVMTVTVDHNLRSESAQEADFVKKEMENLQISHTTLVWTGMKPKTRIEEKARKKRYELIENWCLENQINYLFLAHHIGDQAETFWARLSRGSGVDGLSAMADFVQRNGIILCRPFLSLEKSILTEDLKNRGISWAEDSMNYDVSYERVRWRNRQENLSEYGLSPCVIERTTRRLQRVRMALDFYVRRFMDALVDFNPEGYVSVSKQAFDTLPDEIKIRVLASILQKLNPKKETVSLDSLEKWLIENPKKATMNGCVLAEKNGFLFIAKEYTRSPEIIRVLPWIKTKIGDFIVQSSLEIEVSIGKVACPMTELPYCIRKSIPVVETNTDILISFLPKNKKELEKKLTLDYKNKKKHVVCFQLEEKENE